ncbi:unnamed protein product [Adineta steineri]|uniref:Autophagy-related protein 27 n=2 Tax=Adineta steineri TaxID=433720 RepID=A0A815GPD1_9BILA|nr:unnamed protein product [Adineta steineri]CAF3594215.1 unnamed protein product [Adineta steineri]
MQNDVSHLPYKLIFHKTHGDDCEYTTDEGILDLKAFGYKNRPKYVDVRDSISTNFITYSFNGCFAYSTKDACQNAAACITDEISKKDRLIARQEGRSFTHTQGVSTIIYTDGAGIKVQVFLLCSTSESMQAQRADDNNYIIKIESKCACPGKCIDKSNGLTGGAVFIIVLICIITIYLIISIIFLRFVKHEQGINLIPNRTLWLQIGADAMNGVRFTVSKVRGRDSYEKL